MSFRLNFCSCLQCWFQVELRNRPAPGALPGFFVILDVPTSFVTLNFTRASHLALTLFFCSQFFSMVPRKMKFLWFLDQKCIWSKSKGRHGCYNPGWITCNHFERGISWDVSEINRFWFFLGETSFLSLPFSSRNSWPPSLKVLHERGFGKLKVSCAKNFLQNAYFTIFLL